MEEQLRTLAKMQKLDDRIGALRVLQKELPQQLNEIIGHVDQATANLLACETERAELAKKQRSLESDIKQHQEQIKKYSNQLSEIKTNKEYKALNSEIAFLKEKISEQESHQLELMDAENQAAARVNEAKQELDKAEKAKSEQEGELRRQIDSLEGQIEDLRAQRNTMARTLPLQIVDVDVSHEDYLDCTMSDQRRVKLAWKRMGDNDARSNRFLLAQLRGLAAAM